MDVGLFLKLEAKSGKEDELEELLESALAMAKDETGTRRWFALKFDDGTFAIFDTFDSELDRQAHLDGPIAAMLTDHADELLELPLQPERLDIIAAK